MKNFEKVEAYFNNELNDSEKSDFLSEVESNTELKSEYDFQNEVINGIKEARKVELKAMLDKVPIASIPAATSGLYKILIGGAASLIIGTSLWYYFNSASEVNMASETKVEEFSPIVEESNQFAETKQSVAKLDVEKSSKEETRPSSVKNKNTENSNINKPNVPTAQDDFVDNSLQDENLEIPSDISKVDINLASKVNVEIKVKKKYSFHYQYMQGNLILYGNFEDDLFEVLELNKEDQVEIYLYYESNYYYIKDKSGLITPLEAVANKNLKNKLERLR